MAMEIAHRHLRNDSGSTMRGLDAGETYVVTRHGVPVGFLATSLIPATSKDPAI